MVGTMFFKNWKLLIDKPRKTPIFHTTIREYHEELGQKLIFDETATSDSKLTIHEIESFMWYGILDDRSILSNTLSNEIIVYVVKKINE